MANDYPETDESGMCHAAHSVAAHHSIFELRLRAFRNLGFCMSLLSVHGERGSIAFQEFESAGLIYDGNSSWQFMLPVAMQM